MNRKTKFSFNFPENLKKDGILPTTKQIAFDDLGDFFEERERVKRVLESNSIATLKVDYSDFANHVFFDSAYHKFEIAKNKILTKYPYNGSSETRDTFVLSSSGYENYLLEQQWPKYIGYALFNGTNNYVSASDYDNKLNIGSSSFYVSAFIKPTIVSGNHSIVSFISSSAALKSGFDMTVSGTAIPWIKFTVYSGSTTVAVSSSYASLSSTFRNVSAIYDKPSNMLSLYVNSTKVHSASTAFGSIETNIAKVYIGSGSTTANLFSGAIDEVRIFHTASELFHVKNYNRTIPSEDYLKLKYSFNEGITGVNSIDSIVVDYSQNAIHGAFMNYASRK